MKLKAFIVLVVLFSINRYALSQISDSEGDIGSYPCVVLNDEPENQDLNFGYKKMFCKSKFTCTNIAPKFGA